MVLSSDSDTVAGWLVGWFTNQTITRQVSCQFNIIIKQMCSAVQYSTVQYTSPLN